MGMDRVARWTIFLVTSTPLIILKPFSSEFGVINTNAINEFTLRFRNRRP
jgi:hypothetical protein